MDHLEVYEMMGIYNFVQKIFFIHSLQLINLNFLTKNS